uniref:Pyridoxal-dependent decarboxylase conserved domain protein n=1 Tax=Megaviridae environmental sample TaxID=1737588 RepID=A0A5J6VLU8_9VIRU|nr:MAG: pyridoxal-dependent decarboxylase conserved domain protein [Megaviridae environmental sample]
MIFNNIYNFFYQNIILKKTNIITIFGYYYLLNSLYYFIQKKLKTFNVKNLPYIKNKIDSERANIIQSIKHDLDEENTNVAKYNEIPTIGISQDSLVKIFDKIKNNTSYDYKNGNVSGSMYSKNEGLEQTIIKLFPYFHKSNPLHTNLFPSIRNMENELVTFMIKLFDGSKDTCGTFTSGGTESILLACKTYRDYGYSRGIESPEIIASSTAHCAFNKACKYFNIKLILLPCLYDGTIDLVALKKSISKNTILIVGSTPSYNLGIIDPIDNLSDIALKYNIPLHIDACIGAFLINFTEYKYNFSLKGVTSISADYHKYGQSPKGASCIMYSDKKYMKHQYYIDVKWSGGVYATSTVAGSRCGNIVALTWATLMYTGKHGYLNNYCYIDTLRKHFIMKCNSIDELFIYGNPELSIIAIGSDSININILCDNLKKKKWSINVIQNPNGFHFCLTLYHTEKIINKFIDDVKEILEDLRNKQFEKFSPCIYGTIQKVNNTGIIEDVVVDYLNVVNNVNL